ncbi:Ldh family oxidoreductase [Rhizobiales bacterium RZME27]|uniref:Ldh family oxidoreductase n=1 Tax=Endobacterium cereale TaxID=2663029 RepID=A0A6A8A6Q8_9HYPH|nr:Ldh family oxidoreductase [Endobacterium cereale]MEB2845054.1 Ldh family oxidoreductase [Endobacterium cereale]MQY44966.1 Ldh family oxidoreductase [Endobacterium cereale]
MTISLAEAELLISSVFEHNGVDAPAAASVARALVQAEAAGQSGHGLRRVPAYVKQVLTGKVDGRAQPVPSQPKPGILAINANHGFAYPALDLAAEMLPSIVRKQGIALAAINRSHHAGVMALTVERFAEQGLVAMMFANAPAAMAPWGGKTPLYGTNPIAFAVPVAGADPLVIDLALSKVARGKVMAAHQKHASIPDDWAFDADGNPTTDPAAALNGTMAPAGGAKGAALALMVEVLAAGLTGANFSYQASSLFDEHGPAPSLGHMIIAIDPEAAAGGTAERMAALATEITREEGVRLPGRRGGDLRRTALETGLVIEDDVMAAIAALR